MHTGCTRILADAPASAPVAPPPPRIRGDHVARHTDDLALQRAMLVFGPFLSKWATAHHCAPVSSLRRRPRLVRLRSSSPATPRPFARISFASAFRRPPTSFTSNFARSIAFSCSNSKISSSRSSHAAFRRGTFRVTRTNAGRLATKVLRSTRPIRAIASLRPTPAVTTAPHAATPASHPWNSHLGHDRKRPRRSLLRLANPCPRPPKPPAHSTAHPHPAHPRTPPSRLFSAELGRSKRTPDRSRSLLYTKAYGVPRHARMRPRAPIAATPGDLCPRVSRARHAKPCRALPGRERDPCTLCRLLSPQPVARSSQDCPYGTEARVSCARQGLTISRI